jgi:hypothetical protein
MKLDSPRIWIFPEVDPDDTLLRYRIESDLLFAWRGGYYPFYGFLRWKCGSSRRASEEIFRRVVRRKGVLMPSEVGSLIRKIAYKNYMSETCLKYSKSWVYVCFDGDQLRSYSPDEFTAAELKSPTKLLSRIVRLEENWKRRGTTQENRGAKWE